MDQPIIDIQNMGKRYRLGGQTRLDQTLPEMISEKFRNIFRPKSANTHNPQANTLDFWALRNINIQIQKGEVVGIIGHNGAGKSTLLKILSEITEPTEGHVTLRGRVGSLLEVGTGFHPELTGRENIYLNGAILGMTKQLIKSKFDDIVEFSGVGKFLDTPVKRYSSGMTVRLAFAVAAHLDPEILIVDEVLAVGDASFQKKCLGKMQDVADKHGRTVLFVSHNMSAISNLCQRVILLKDGMVIGDGSADELIPDYLNSDSAHEHVGHRIYLPNQEPKKQGVVLTAIELLNEAQQPVGSVGLNHDFSIKITIQVENKISAPAVAIALRDTTDTLVFNSTNHDQKIPLKHTWEKGKIIFECQIPKHLLNSQRYYVGVWVGIPCEKTLIQIDRAFCFDAIAMEGAERFIRGSKPGTVAPILTWRQTDYSELKCDAA